MLSHCFAQQGFSSSSDLMMESASVFKNIYYHYSLQGCTKASFGSNKGENVYFKDSHFLLNVWIKLQSVASRELSYVPKRRFCRSTSCPEIGLWLALEFPNAADWFCVTVAATGFCILASWGQDGEAPSFACGYDEWLPECLPAHIYFLFNKNNSQYHSGNEKSS